MAVFDLAQQRGKENVGKGSARNYQRYQERSYSLDKDGNKHDRRVDLIAGDLDFVTTATEAMTAEHTFFPGIVGFTLEESQRLSADELDQMALKYLDHLCHPIGRERCAYSVVRHTSEETGRVDYHVTVVRQDMQTGKNFQPWVVMRGDMHRQKIFTELTNLEHGGDDPNDPARARLDTNFSRTASAAALKKQISEALETMHCRGELNSRDDVISQLNDWGFKIATRRGGKPVIGDGYLSIENPNGGNNIRFKGGLYSESYAGLDTSETALEQSAARATEDRKARIATLRKLYAEADKKRAEHFSKIIHKAADPDFRDLDRAMYSAAGMACSVSRAPAAERAAGMDAGAGSRGPSHNSERRQHSHLYSVAGFEALDDEGRRDFQTFIDSTRSSYLSAVDECDGKAWRFKHTDRPAVFQNRNGSISPASSSDSSINVAGAVAAEQMQRCVIRADSRDIFDRTARAIIAAGGEVVSGEIGGVSVDPDHLSRLHDEALQPAIQYATSRICAPKNKPQPTPVPAPKPQAEAPKAVFSNNIAPDAEATEKALRDAANIDDDGNDLDTDLDTTPTPDLDSNTDDFEW